VKLQSSEGAKFLVLSREEAYKLLVQLTNSLAGQEGIQVEPGLKPFAHDERTDAPIYLGVLPAPRVEPEDLPRISTQMPFHEAVRRVKKALRT